MKVVVVLGAAVWAGGRPSPTMARRCNKAVELWRRGGIDVVIPSGGLGAHPPPEADVMSDLLVAGGVPVDAIERDRAATTTMETAANVARMLEDRGITRVIAVTDPSHGPRTWLAFRCHDLPVRLALTRGVGPKSRISVVARQFLREVIALPVYFVRSFGALFGPGKQDRARASDPAGNRAARNED